MRHLIAMFGFCCLAAPVFAAAPDPVCLDLDQALNHASTHLQTVHVVVDATDRLSQDSHHDEEIALQGQMFHTVNDRWIKGKAPHSLLDFNNSEFRVMGNGTDANPYPRCSLLSTTLDGADAVKYGLTISTPNGQIVLTSEFWFSVDQRLHRMEVSLPRPAGIHFMANFNYLGVNLPTMP